MEVFGPREYRDFSIHGRFETFVVKVESSDLYIKALKKLEREAHDLIVEARAQVELEILRRPEFLRTLAPIPELGDEKFAPQRMLRASKKAGVGPMAAVAGAVAEYVGRGLMEYSEEVMIENGGDIFMRVYHETIVGVVAPGSPFSGKLGLRLPPSPLPIGVCASSATVGPSLSKGRANCAMVISRDAPLADAVATAMGNRINEERDLQNAIDWALTIEGVSAALAIIGDKIAVKGDLGLVPLD